MPELVASSPLGTGGPMHWASASVTVSECAELGLMHIKGRVDEAAAERIAGALGVRLPGEFGRLTQAPVRALRVREDHWCVIVEQSARAPLLRGLRQAVSGTSLLVADVSDGVLWLRVAGAAAAALIAAGCALDLDRGALPVEHAAWTRLARLRVLIARRTLECFELQVDASYAHYAWDWLVENAALADAACRRTGL